MTIWYSTLHLLYTYYNVLYTLFFLQNSFELPLEIKLLKNFSKWEWSFFSFFLLYWNISTSNKHQVYFVVICFFVFVLINLDFTLLDCGRREKDREKFLTQYMLIQPNFITLLSAYFIWAYFIFHFIFHIHFFFSHSQTD